MPIIEQLLYQTQKSSHWRCSIKKLFVKILQFSQEWSALKSLLVRVWNKVAGPCNFIKIRLQHRHFPVNIAKFPITPVLTNICMQLLLKIMIKEDFLEKPSVKDQRLVVVDHWPVIDCCSAGVHTVIPGNK